MVTDGLLNKILLAAARIDTGRKNLAADGFEHAGRISYEDGITLSLETFIEAQKTADSLTMILIELTFLQQELQFCDQTDSFAYGSLSTAMQSFEDALRCLKIVEDKVSV